MEETALTYTESVATRGNAPLTITESTLKTKNALVAEWSPALTGGVDALLLPLFDGLKMLLEWRVPLANPLPVEKYTGLVAVTLVIEACTEGMSLGTAERVGLPPGVQKRTQAN